jgi:hypothetical protein
MKTIDLQKIQHNVKQGDVCGDLLPNIKESCLLVENKKVVGFFISKIPEKMQKLAAIADKELNSDRVPKSMMDRSDVVKKNKQQGVTQYSALLGSVPPKPHARRHYANYASVHSKKTAQLFIRAMLGLAKESEALIKQYMPKQYNYLYEQCSKNIDKKWLFSNIFTSSISNYNIAANFHTDKANFKGSLNAIICKRKGATGGNLCVPDYNAIFDQCDNSMLVYPAWKNMHGVTPINTYANGGYRNTLVFYLINYFMSTTR